MRAVPIHQAYPALTVTPRDEVLAKQADRHWVTVWFRQFLREASGYPMAAHQLPHRRIPFHTTQ